MTDVDAQGIAGQTGIQPGDLLLQVNDATVRNLEEFSLEMEKVTEGDTVEFKILRISIGLFGQIERRFLVRLPGPRAKAEWPAPVMIPDHGHSLRAEFFAGHRVSPGGSGKRSTVAWMARRDGAVQHSFGLEASD